MPLLFKNNLDLTECTLNHSETRFRIEQMLGPLIPSCPIFRQTNTGVCMNFTSFIILLLCCTRITIPHNRGMNEIQNHFFVCFIVPLLYSRRNELVFPKCGKYFSTCQYFLQLKIKKQVNYFKIFVVKTGRRKRLLKLTRSRVSILICTSRRQYSIAAFSDRVGFGFIQFSNLRFVK